MPTQTTKPQPNLQQTDFQEADFQAEGFPERFQDSDCILITEAGIEALTAALIVPDKQEEETPEAFTPDTADKANWVLGKIAGRRAAAARIRENAELMASAEEREADGLEWKYGAVLQTWLRGELAGGKRKSVRLFHGVLGFRTRPAGISVTNDAAALAWAQENAPQAVSVRLDKKALADALLATGEAVDFAAFTPADETFYIK